MLMCSISITVISKTAPNCVLSLHCLYWHFQVSLIAEVAIRIPQYTNHQSIVESNAHRKNGLNVNPTKGKLRIYNRIRQTIFLTEPQAHL